MNIEYLLIYSVFCRGVCGNLELEKTANLPETGCKSWQAWQAGKLQAQHNTTTQHARLIMKHKQKKKGGGVQEKKKKRKKKAGK